MGAIVGLLLLLGLGIGWGTDGHAAELAFDLRIEQGRVAKNMRLIRVKQGDSVTLRWTSDRPIVLHLHGYDIEVKVEPGAVAEMAFVARATGRFSVEEHKTDSKGGHSHGEAALVRIEVMPPALRGAAVRRVIPEVEPRRGETVRDRVERRAVPVRSAARRRLPRT